MTTTRRLAALTLSALALTAVATVTSVESAQAVAVAHNGANGNTEIYLDANETYVVKTSGHASTVCGNAISKASSQGITITDEQRHSCEMAVLICVGQATSRGNALSGVRFLPTPRYEVAQYTCLVR